MIMLIKNLYEWKPISTRSAGRPKNSWKNGIKENLSTMKINNWTRCIQDRIKWREVVEKTKTFKHCFSTWWRRRGGGCTLLVWSYC
jgi:hypothetical protein